MKKCDHINIFESFQNAGHQPGDLCLDDMFFSRISSYISLVEKWGRSHNIVSSNFTADELNESVYDSIVGGSFLSFPTPVYDAGSGGGFPGIVLALALAGTEFFLIESNRKKCSFLRLVKSQLGLQNIHIENKRIETFSNIPFITTKAAFSPPNSAILAGSLSSGGKLAIWATPKTKQDFLTELMPAGLQLVKEYPYEVPGGKKRLILLFEK